MPFSSHAAVIAYVAHHLAQKGHQCYVVGGFIRDWLLGRETNDIDIAVAGDAIALGRQVATEMQGRFVLLDDVNSISRVVVPATAGRDTPVHSSAGRAREWNIDFSSYTSGDVETDLARRDFTVNAMAADPERLVEVLQHEGKDTAKDMLIDPFSGQADLRRKSVRAVSSEVFEADPARLLRGVRLAAELDFVVEPHTEQLIGRDAWLVAQVAGERVREELSRILSLSGSADQLRYLDQLGLLASLIPELEQGKGVEQPTTHFWDVFDHSIETVAALEFLLRESEWTYGSHDMLRIVPWDSETEAHLSSRLSKEVSRKALLKLGALLHDVSKPETKMVDASGRARFLGHAQQGAEKAEQIMVRLRFSRQETGLVQTLVKYHLRPVQMSQEGLPTQRAIYRFFRDTEGAGVDLLYLALADHLATRGPLVNMKDWQQHCEITGYILAQHREQQIRVKPHRLVDGHDVMSAFGLRPGPMIGRLLTLIDEAHASGEVRTREEALALAQREVNKEEDLTGIAN